MGIFSKKKESFSNDLPDYLIDLKDLDCVFSIIVINSEYEIKYINKKFSDDFGFNFNELVNQSVDKLLAFKSDGSKEKIHWQTYLGNYHSKSIRFYSNSGDEFICVLKTIHKDNGDFYLFFESSQSIDATKSNLQESVSIYRQLINNTPDIICFKDGEGKWLLANEADLELFHLTEVDYFGKTDQQLAEFTHEVYKQAFLTCIETDEKCWEKANISRSDELIEKPDGTKVILDVIKIPVFNEDGSRKNLIVLGRDVTARRNMESDLIDAKQKAEESDKLKSNFLATMSHELRTPLNAVIGFANLIYEEDNIDEIHDYSRIIHNNSKMLLNLIEDVFDVSLIESDQIQIDQRKFDLIKAIREVYEIFPMELNMLDKLDLDFKLIFDRDSFDFFGDEFRIKQILTNLIRNALKFTKKGFIHLELKIVEHYIDLKVIDSGIGISKEKMSEIFGLFRQVEEGSKRSFGGAGLGLSISKRLAKMMNGDILVESEINKGSTFTLRLPID